MTQEELRAIPEFVKWVEQGQARGHLRTLTDAIDELLGDLIFPNEQMHGALMNAGKQHAIREIRVFLRDILGRNHPVRTSPPATYGVTDSNP